MLHWIYIYTYYYIYIYLFQRVNKRYLSKKIRTVFRRKLMVVSRLWKSLRILWKIWFVEIRNKKKLPGITGNRWSLRALRQGPKKNEEKIVVCLYPDDTCWRSSSRSVRKRSIWTFFRSVFFLFCFVFSHHPHSPYPHLKIRSEKKKIEKKKEWGLGTKASYLG